MAGMDAIETLTLDIAISEQEIASGAKSLLSLVRPRWDSQKVNFKIFTNGITNKLIGCWHEHQADDIVLVRIYGQNTDLLIDREAETKNFKRHGYAPKLYAVFKNGLAYEYVPGDILDVSSVRSPSVYPLVAKMMARIHKIECNDVKPVLWEKLNKYISLVPSTYSSEAKQTLFKNTFPEGIQSLYLEVKNLENDLGNLQSKVVFCHNDLLLANIIHTDGQVTFIDYEYAACNYQAYDIGNHFAEFAGVSSVDYSNYPGYEFQRGWLKTYLEEFNTNDDCRGDISDEEVDELYICVNKFALVSHVFWALWALVQAEHSTIDFDFIGYAGTRMAEYFSKKENFLSLKSSIIAKNI